MKRLLAYLFIVLGLGLTFNANAEADNYCIPKKAENHFNSIYIWEECYVYHKKVDLNTFVEFALTNALNSVGVLKESPLFLEENLKWLKKYLRENNISKSKINKSIKRVKIAKKEPGKTQRINIANCREVNVLSGKVRFLKNNEAPIVYKNINIDFLNKRIEFEKNKNWVKFNNTSKKIYQTNFKHGSEDNIILSHVVAMHQGTSLLTKIDYKLGIIEQGQNQQMKLICEKINNTKTKFAKLFDDKSLNIKKTQIAKTEPSQTQEETQGFASYGGDDKLKKLAFCIDANHDNTYQYSLPYINGLGCGDGNISTNYKDYIKKNIEYFKSRKKQFKQTDQGLYNIAVTKLKKEFKKYGIKNDILISVLNDEEPKITPKKKVKVAKVEDSTQEEFKPKKTNQDNEAPVITIAEAITVNDSDYEFEGTVTDKSKQIFIEVDGRLVDVKKGKFTVKGYSPVDKEISIQAIDGYGNRSKPKIVKLIIDIKATDMAEKLEPLNPSKIRAKVSKNRVALIIGIENYIEAPKANYANLDAKYFFDYARKGFGIKKQNINLLVDENATFVKTSKALTLWLKTKIKADQTDLVVFFAGHGLASNDGKELYLLPQDSDPNLLDITALSRTKLFQTIIDLKPKSVTMFLDTCYSGVSRDEQMLLASARPIRIVADEQEGIPDNFTIFTASQVEQISSGLKEANHGIFSYYLMKGLEGKADTNQDKQITNGELLAYMDENVSQKASELGRQQNPSLSGDPDEIIMSYR